jgi:riboflavin synthase
MFTGLVQATGTIDSVRPLEGGAWAGIHIEVDARGLAPRPIAVGDSIAVSGVCLTATTVDGLRFGADVSLETLSKTTGLDRPGAVNLETSLALGDKLGGHLVSGHVDGVGTVERCAPVGESVELVVLAPAALARLLAPKGSVAVDGVSLTVNRVEDVGAGGCRISINLIPHTLAATTFKELVAGSRVNLEVDMIARYVARMLAPG